MTHHRCTRCKEESNPRHKYQGGVFCSSCIRFIRGFRPDSVRRQGLFGSLWHKITSFVDRVDRAIHHTHIVKLNIREDSRKVSTRLKTMEVRALSIPPNPAAGAPQKR